MDSNKPVPIPQRASRDAIAAKISPEAALFFSKAAYDNALRLIDAAVMLNAQEHHGPARSLAISAREEFGKFFAALLHCVGIHPAQWLADNLRKHSSKQTLGAVLALLGGPLKSVSQHLEPAIKVEGSTMREVFDRMAANLQTVVANIPMPDEKAIAEMQVTLERAHSGGDDLRRAEGLYADLIDNGAELEIRSPRSVTADQALDEIECARAYVQWASPLVKAIAIEELNDESTFPVQDVIAELRRFAAAILPLIGPASGTGTEPPRGAEGP